MSSQHIGAIMIGIGLLVVLAGAIAWLGGFSWFGDLPGDVRVQRERHSIHIPITSMIVISIVLTIILNIALRIIRRFF